MNDNRPTWEDAVVWLRGQKDQQELVHWCYYDDPIRDAAERFYTGAEWNDVRGLISVPVGHALDVGAGRGIASYALARDGWKVTALEPDPSRIVGSGCIAELMKSTGTVFSVIEDRGETLPFSDGSFDLVYGRQVLHHAGDLEKFCKEVARVLRPGGQFIATREHVITNKKDLQTFLDNHPLHEIYRGENAFLLSEYKRAIRKSGIRITRILNPYQSSINLFPLTPDAMAEKIFLRIGVRLPFMKNILFKILGEMNNEPGRLYSFVGYRR